MIPFVSAGVLIYSIHSANKKPFKLFGTNLETYKAFAMDLKFGKYPQLTCIPSGIVDNVRLMLHYNPDTRPNLFELLKVTFVASKNFNYSVFVDNHRSFNDKISTHFSFFSYRFPTSTILVWKHCLIWSLSTNGIIYKSRNSSKDFRRFSKNSPSV